MPRIVEFLFTESHTVKHNVALPAFYASPLSVEDFEQDEMAQDAGHRRSNGRAVMILDENSMLSIKADASADTWSEPQEIDTITLEISRPWFVEDPHYHFHRTPEAAAAMITWLDLISDRIRFARQQAQAVIDAR